MSLIMPVRMYILKKWTTLHSVPDLEHQHEVRSPGTEKIGHINTFKRSQVTVTSGHGLATKKSNSDET